MQVSITSLIQDSWPLYESDPKWYKSRDKNSKPAISKLAIRGEGQTKNALALVEKNAAIYVRDSELNDQLYPRITELIANEEMQNEMGNNIKEFALPEATEKIVDEVIRLLDNE